MLKEKDNQAPDTIENDVIDHVVKILYNNTDEPEMDFEQDILPHFGHAFSAKDVKHLWAVVLATNLVDAAVGFGKSGKLYLTQPGMQMMKMYGGYMAYLEQQRNMQLLQAVPAIAQLAKLAQEQSTNQKAPSAGESAF